MTGLKLSWHFKAKDLLVKQNESHRTDASKANFCIFRVLSICGKNNFGSGLYNLIRYTDITTLQNINFERIPFVFLWLLCHLF